MAAGATVRHLQRRTLRRSKYVAHALYETLAIDVYQERVAARLDARERYVGNRSMSERPAEVARLTTAGMKVQAHR